MKHLLIMIRYVYSWLQMGSFFYHLPLVSDPSHCVLYDSEAFSILQKLAVVLLFDICYSSSGYFCKLFNVSLNSKSYANALGCYWWGGRIYGPHDTTLSILIFYYSRYVTYRMRKERVAATEYNPLSINQEPEYEQFIENSEKEARVSWSRWVAYKLCFINSIDSDTVEVYSHSHKDETPPLWESLIGLYSYPSTFSWFMQKTAIYRSDAEDLIETKAATYKNLFLLCLYELSIMAAWMWLDGYTGMILGLAYW